MPTAEDISYSGVMELRSQSLSRVFEEIIAGRSTVAGVDISPELALECSGVLACVRVLSESIASLPMNYCHRLTGGGKEVAADKHLHEVLHYQPNSWMTSFEFRELMQSWLLLWGNAYAHIKGSIEHGAVAELIPLHPSRMEAKRLENGRLRYYYRKPATLADPAPTPDEYRQDEIFHLRWLSSDGVTGFVPTTLSKDAISLARATELHSSAFFGNAGVAGTYIETDQPQKPETLRRFREQWDAAHAGPKNHFKTVVMPFGFKKKSDPINNRDAALIETRRWQLEEICRVYRVPPHLVGDLQNVRFSTVEQSAIDFVTFSLIPWCRRWEMACRRDLVVDDKNYFVEFDTNALMAGDYAARSQFLREMANMGVLDVDEVRSQIGYNPLPNGEGKKRFIQVNMQLLSAFTPENPTAAAPATQESPSGSAGEGATGNGSPSQDGEVDSAVAEPTATRSLDAAEALFRTTLRRIGAIEIDGILERRSKPEKITQWFGQIEEKMRIELRDAAEATGRELDPFVASWVTRSKDLLLGCHRSGSKYETVAGEWFERHFDEVGHG
jgi:HK97 family phage portal protein